MEHVFKECDWFSLYVAVGIYMNMPMHCGHFDLDEIHLILLFFNSPWSENCQGFCFLQKEFFILFFML